MSDKLDEKAVLAAAEAEARYDAYDDLLSLSKTMRERYVDRVRAAITAYLAACPGSTGAAEGWVLVPKGRYRELVEEELWNAFNCGIERDGKWMDGGRSEGEWLVQRLGLPSSDAWHDAEVMKGMMSAAVDRALSAAGESEG